MPIGIGTVLDFILEPAEIKRCCQTNPSNWDSKWV